MSDVFDKNWLCLGFKLLLPVLTVNIDLIVVISKLDGNALLARGL